MRFFRKHAYFHGFILSAVAVGAFAADARLTRQGLQIQAGLDGEIYPVFANYASLQKQNDRRFATLSVTITNPTGDAVVQRVSVQVPGWSDQETQVAELAAGASQTLSFAPSFLPRFYQNHEIVAATAHVSVTDTGGRSVFETTAPVRL